MIEAFLLFILVFTFLYGLNLVDIDITKSLSLDSKENEIKLDKNQPRRFIRYIPSNLERKWCSVIKLQQVRSIEEYSLLLDKYEDKISSLLSSIRKCLSNRGYSCYNNDFSYFIYDNNGKIEKEYIEPLFGILSTEYQLYQDYIYEDIFNQHFIIPSHIIAKEYSLVYIDTDASLYYNLNKQNQNFEGVNQRFIYNIYHGKMIYHFKEWFLFDNDNQNSSKIYSHLPNALIPVYHYYNIKPQLSSSSLLNPLNLLIKYDDDDYYNILKLNISQNIDRYICNRIKHDDRIKLNELFLTYTPSAAINHFNVYIFYSNFYVANSFLKIMKTFSIC